MEESPKQTPPVAKTPATLTPQILAISDEAVIAPALTPSGDFIKYYSRMSGKVYQIDSDGSQKTALSNQELTSLSDVLWSSDKTKVISKFTQPNGDAQFYYYDYTTQQGTPIKKNTDEISWDLTGNKIFYKYYDANSQTRSLNIANPDGTNWKRLADISYRTVSIAPIPKSGLVSFWNKADSFTETSFESIPVIGGEKKTIFTGKFGADYRWNGDGSSVLISHADAKGGSKMQLAVTNYNGGEYKNLEVPTMVSKCVWSKDDKTVFYALPGAIPDSAVMPNEYNDNKISSVDTFWKINTLTGEKSRILDLDKINGKFDATKLFLNSDESVLFFTNRNDGKLYRINL